MTKEIIEKLENAQTLLNCHRLGIFEYTPEEIAQAKKDIYEAKSALAEQNEGVA